MTLILNSVLSYTAKCISNKLEIPHTIKLMKDFYSEIDINHAWKLSRSFLQKKDRPKRQIGNYQNLTNLETEAKCKQIVKCVKNLNSSGNFILASSSLNVPFLQNKKINESVAYVDNSTHSLTVKRDLNNIRQKDFQNKSTSIDSDYLLKSKSNKSCQVSVEFYETEQLSECEQESSQQFNTSLLQEQKTSTPVLQKQKISTPLLQKPTALEQQQQLQSAVSTPVLQQQRAPVLQQQQRQQQLQQQHFINSICSSGTTATFIHRTTTRK